MQQYINKFHAAIKWDSDEVALNFMQEYPKITEVVVDGSVVLEASPEIETVTSLTMTISSARNLAALLFSMIEQNEPDNDK